MKTGSYKDGKYLITKFNNGEEWTSIPCPPMYSEEELKSFESLPDGKLPEAKRESDPLVTTELVWIDFGVSPAEIISTEEMLKRQ